MLKLQQECDGREIDSSWAVEQGLLLPSLSEIAGAPRLGCETKPSASALVDDTPKTSPERKKRKRRTKNQLQRRVRSSNATGYYKLPTGEFRVRINCDKEEATRPKVVIGTVSCESTARKLAKRAMVLRDGLKPPDPTQEAYRKRLGLKKKRPAKGFFVTRGGKFQVQVSSIGQGRINITTVDSEKTAGELGAKAMALRDGPTPPKTRTGYLTRLGLKSKANQVRFGAKSYFKSGSRYALQARLSDGSKCHLFCVDTEVEAKKMGRKLQALRSSKAAPKDRAGYIKKLGLSKDARHYKVQTRTGQTRSLVKQKYSAAQRTAAKTTKNLKKRKK